MIKQIFNADSVYACDKYEIYKSDNKVVIVSNNLSGAGRGIIGKSDILNILDRIKEWADVCPLYALNQDPLIVLPSLPWTQKMQLNFENFL